jgi:hypothetical protein
MLSSWCFLLRRLCPISGDGRSAVDDESEKKRRKQRWAFHSGGAVRLCTSAVAPLRHCREIKKKKTEEEAQCQLPLPCRDCYPFEEGGSREIRGVGRGGLP